MYSFLVTYPPAPYSFYSPRHPTAGGWLAQRCLLGLLPLGGRPLLPAARAQVLLDEVNTTCALRMETTYRYAQGRVQVICAILWLK